MSLFSLSLMSESAPLMSHTGTLPLSIELGALVTIALIAAVSAGVLIGEFRAFRRGFTAHEKTMNTQRVEDLKKLREWKNRDKKDQREYRHRVCDRFKRIETRLDTWAHFANGNGRTPPPHTPPRA